MRRVRGVGDVVKMVIGFQSMWSLGDNSTDFGIYSKYNGKPLEMEGGCPVSGGIRARHQEERRGWVGESKELCGTR